MAAGNPFPPPPVPRVPAPDDDRRAVRVRWPWTHFAAEAVLIVLSILLALAVDSWRENRALDRQRDLVLTSLRAEIESNRAAVEAVVPYHRSVLDALEERIGTGAPAGGAGLELLASIAPRGLQPPDIHHTAWETAVATNTLALFDFETTALLARLYDGQRIGAERTIERIQEVALGRDIHEPGSIATTLRQLHTLSRELVGQELQLIQRYDEALAGLPAQD